MSAKELTHDNLREVAGEVNGHLISLSTIQAVKVVRDYTGLSLYDSKRIVDEVKDAAPIGSFFHDTRRTAIIIDKLRPHVTEASLPSQQVWDAMLMVEGLMSTLDCNDGELAKAFSALALVWADLRIRESIG